MTTTNLDLMKIADELNLPLVCVVQRDDLIHQPYVNNGFYIINIQPSTQGNGQHWVCLYLNKATSFYFDSFAVSPPTDVIQFVRKYSKHLKHNNLIIQNLKSDNCGIFCIIFILFMVKNKYNYLDYIEEFDTNNDTKRNDAVLEGLARIYIGKTSNAVINKFFRNTK